MKTKRIRLTPDNEAAITEAIEAAQQYARVRLLSAETLIHSAEEAEKHLGDLGIPKRLRKEATAERLPARVPNSYRGRAEGTAALIERGTQHWYLTAVWRAECGHQSYGGYPRVTVSVRYHADLLDAICRAHGVNVARPPQDVA